MRTLFLLAAAITLIACAPDALPAVDAGPRDAVDAPETPADTSAGVDAATDAPEAAAEAAVGHDAPADTGCPEHAERTSSGSCRCVAGYTSCDGACRDLWNDNANCGACGALCEGGVCARGQCVTVAPPPDAGPDASDAACASMTPGNCCGVACPTHPTATGATCVAGRCGFVCAVMGGMPVNADCDGNAANGCETDLRSSAANCGACGAACAPHRQCVDRACSTCASGFTDCDGNPANGCEVNLNGDAMNCGRCGAPCAPGFPCEGGACRR